MFKMSSFVDEVIKLSGIAGEVASGLWKQKKPLGYAAGGAAAILGGKRLLENQAMAEQMRDQMAARG